MPIDHDGLQPSGDERIIPLYGEKLSIARREIESALISVDTVTRSREEIVDEHLSHEHIEVKRIPIGRQIEIVPDTREEGDTTIVSIVEEIVVVERRLVLKEEIHLRRVRTSGRHLEKVVLREQDVIITRTEKDPCCTV